MKTREVSTGIRSLSRRSRRALWAVLCLFVPAATLSLPLAAGANCRQDTSQCVRLKAGKVVKKGECETFECGSMTGAGFGATFQDEDKEGAGIHVWQKPGKKETVKLDGRPAKRQNKPVMGKDWTCLRKNGTKEVMCVNDQF